MTGNNEPMNPSIVGTHAEDYLEVSPPSAAERFVTDNAAVAVVDECVEGCGPCNPLDYQVGGSHYKDMPIQPIEFCQKNRLPYCESNVIKYVCRWRAKGQKQDIHKAIHYLNMLLKLECEQ